MAKSLLVSWRSFLTPSIKEKSTIHKNLIVELPFSGYYCFCKICPRDKEILRYDLYSSLLSAYIKSQLHNIFLLWEALWDNLPLRFWQGSRSCKTLVIYLVWLCQYRQTDNMYFLCQWTKIKCNVFDSISMKMFSLCFHFGSAYLDKFVWMSDCVQCKLSP